jgi:aminoglycoside phosphotransferase (APT) family kinase protein
LEAEMAEDTLPLEELVPVERVRAYLRERFPERDEPLVLEGRSLGGSSNITAFLRWGDEEVVLRRPPAGELLPTSHDMLREYRFISALTGTDVPVPRPIVDCPDPGVIGAPFYLMGRVDGVTVGETLPPELDSLAQRRALCETFVDTLVALHKTDWRGKDLPGRPDGYMQRQFKRWMGQLELTEPQTRKLPGIDRVNAWLAGNLPDSPRQTIVHGDYGMHNALFSRETPTRVLALVDWEMATLGDPLADLGWLLYKWGAVQTKGIRNASKEITALPGFLTHDEIVARYEEASGEPVENIAFYEVFGLWKQVIITEGLYALYLQGTAANPVAARFETETPEQVEQIIDLIDAFESRS